MFSHFHKLLLRVGLTMSFFAMYRVMFYLYNQDSIGASTASEWIWIWIGGLRFDLCASLYTNILVVLLHILPLKSRDTQWWQKLTFAVYMIFNTVAMSLELGTIAYYPFNLRRLLLADFRMIDNTDLVGQSFLNGYWYVFVGFSGMLVLLFLLYRMTTRNPALSVEMTGSNYYAKHTGLFLLFAGLTLIGLRGGLQKVPVIPSTASDYVIDKRKMNLVSNSTLNVILSAQQRSMSPVTYITDETKLEQLFNLQRNPHNAEPFKRMNVVVLILESFGKEMTGVFNPEKEISYTPFFDSLARQSLYFKDSYANGTRSMQGISSLLSGIPCLMPDPFIHSSYQANRIPSLGAELKKMGYKTAFFHPGVNGTQSFDSYCGLAEFDNYYGQTDYNHTNPNNKDYDGTWGIWDEPFYDFFLKKLATDYQSGPFCGAYFTISPHHPYTAPEWFIKANPRVPQGRYLSQLYGDFCLRTFFEKAKKTSWYKNTLFVLSADHVCQPIENPDYNNPNGRFKIPILFYAPSDSTLRGEKDGFIQQIDVTPTVLRYLNYPNVHYSFGKALSFTSDNGESFQAVSVGNYYQITNGKYLLESDGQKAIAMYDLKSDTSCKIDVKDKHPDLVSRFTAQLQILLQVHYNAMEKNKLVRN